MFETNVYKMVSLSPIVYSSSVVDSFEMLLEKSKEITWLDDMTTLLCLNIRTSCPQAAARKEYLQIASMDWLWLVTDISFVGALPISP